MDCLTCRATHQASVCSIVNLTTYLILEVHREIKTLPGYAGTETTIYVWQYITAKVVATVIVGGSSFLTYHITVLNASIAFVNLLASVIVVNVLIVLILLIYVLIEERKTCLRIYTRILLGIVSKA